jgi:hypothetical protein
MWTVNVQPHSFLASALDKDGQSASYSSHFTCWERALIPTVYWMGLRFDLGIKKKRKISSSSLESNSNYNSYTP